MGSTFDNPHVKNLSEFHDLFSQRFNEYLGEKEKMEKIFTKLMKESTKKAQLKKIDEAVQVKTWPVEESVGVQVKTWPTESEVFQATIPEIIEPEPEPAAPLTRNDIYLQELDQSMLDARSNIHTITGILNEGAGVLNLNHENIVSTLNDSTPMLHV